MDKQQDVASGEVKGMSMTVETILELSEAISSTVTQYAIENTDNQMVDIFLLQAALGHVALKSGMGVFTKNTEEGVQMFENVRDVAYELLKKMDAIHLEKPMSEGQDILVIAHLMTVLSELYVKRRDQVMSNLQDVAPQNKE